jgi:hypothetical protein
MKAAWNFIGVIAVLAAEHSKDGLSKTGEVIADGWITGRIHERFVGESAC